MWGPHPHSCVGTTAHSSQRPIQLNRGQVIAKTGLAVRNAEEAALGSPRMGRWIFRSQLRQIHGRSDNGVH
jgi:hypothetical protein